MEGAGGWGKEGGEDDGGLYLSILCVFPWESILPQYSHSLLFLAGCCLFLCVQFLCVCACARACVFCLEVVVALSVLFFFFFWYWLLFFVLFFCLFMLVCFVPEMILCG